MSHACSALFAPSEFIGLLSEIRSKTANSAKPPPIHAAAAHGGEPPAGIAWPAGSGADLATAPPPSKPPDREDPSAAR